LTYPLACSRWQLSAIAKNLWQSRRQHPARIRRVALESAVLLGGHAGCWLLAVELHGAWSGSAVYLATVAMPAALATYFMMFTNYIQHVDCDPASPDDHSRNFTSPLWNWFVFDNGFHSVHHEQPGVHWSRYRALHAERAARIHPSLNLATPLTYLVDAYLRSPARRRSHSFDTMLTTSSE
jgi:fatty acid desaturase